MMHGVYAQFDYRFADRRKARVVATPKPHAGAMLCTLTPRRSDPDREHCPARMARMRGRTCIINNAKSAKMG